MATATAQPYYQNSSEIQLAPGSESFLKLNAGGNAFWQHRQNENNANPLQSLEFDTNTFKINQAGSAVLTCDNANSKVLIAQPLDMGNQQITNMAAGSASGHSVEYAQMNTALAGKYDNTVTLDNITAPTAAVDLNSQKITSLAAGTASGDAVEYAQMNTALAGKYSTSVTLDNITAATAALDLNSQKITSLAAGTASGDAVEYDQMNAAIASASGAEQVSLQKASTADQNFSAGTLANGFFVDVGAITYQSASSNGLQQLPRSTDATGTNTRYKYGAVTNKLQALIVDIRFTLKSLDGSKQPIFQIHFDDGTTQTAIYTHYIDQQMSQDLSLVRQFQFITPFKSSSSGHFTFSFQTDCDILHTVKSGSSAWLTLLE